jgi:hypothetical protein
MKNGGINDPEDARWPQAGRRDALLRRLLSYNVRAVVDAQHHLIVAHETTNIGNDDGQLSTMARLAQAAMGASYLTTIADRGSS